MFVGIFFFFSTSFFYAVRDVLEKSLQGDDFSL